MTENFRAYASRGQCFRSRPAGMLTGLFMNRYKSLMGMCPAKNDR